MKQATRRRSRYVIGIDLGTTNSAVCYIDTGKDPFGGGNAVQTFAIPQLIAEGEVAERGGLPSFLYVSMGHDLPEGSLDLPWVQGRDFAVGELARMQGAKVPGRLVSSAKSWLCHSGVDRTAPILPWGDVGEVEKRSPVETSALYLGHVRDAWNHVMAGGDATKMFEQQELILTVPASFDEVARELTLEAAKKAGFSHVTLLEEPQAAFYSWIARHEADWDKIVGPGTVILICDIGGGTTDFTLICVREGEAAPVPERIAVGEHLMLGGDNMDLALAGLVESRMLGNSEKRLDSLRWHILTSLCRSAKEKILGDRRLQSVPISLPGRGRDVVGGALSGSLNLEDVQDAIIKGFFPHTQPNEAPMRNTRIGIHEWGLPFAADPIIPRHLAAFLRSHQTKGEGSSLPLRPDAVFFNGGVFTADTIRERLVEILSAWFSRAGQAEWSPVVLENNVPALAVARGAAYYGMVRRGRGIRIVGGSPRSYYVRVVPTDATEEEPGQITAVCVIPRGMEEGEEVDIESPAFEVLTNRPVSFSLYSSSSRTGDLLGRVLATSEDSLFQLPPLYTVLRFGKKGVVRKIPVYLCARLTEIGTLELSCHSRVTDHRWKLQFKIRQDVTEGRENKKQPGERREKESVPEKSVASALKSLEVAFRMEKPLSDSQVTPATLMKALRKHIGMNKASWPLAVLRRLSDRLLRDPETRKKSPRHEERWLNLAGFCLRPGYGDSADDYRMRQIWKIYHAGLTFPRDQQCRMEWWVLWRRVAGGLNEKQQMTLFRDFSPFLLPGQKGRTKQPRLTAQERGEMWRTMANLERLPCHIKEEIGAALTKHIGTSRGEGLNMWVLSRIGSRIPLYGPLNAVVPRKTVAGWVKQVLETKWKKPDQTGFCVVQMGCFTGDRERDLDANLRDRVGERLLGLEDGERLAQRLYEMVSLSATEQGRVFGEGLPGGLHLAE
ncbi:MAG: hsp70 family protein [Desulfobacterales bacterium]|nr:hsp70 family protein [Desulfobacterales bacterium]